MLNFPTLSKQVQGLRILKYSPFLLITKVQGEEKKILQQNKRIKVRRKRERSFENLTQKEMNNSLKMKEKFKFLYFRSS